MPYIHQVLASLPNYQDYEHCNPVTILVLNTPYISLTPYTDSEKNVDQLWWPRRGIINVSSLAARTGSPNEYIDYAASKGAVDSLTRGLAIEVAGEGIRVNAVRPGLIHTEIHADGGEPERVDRLKNKIPMKRGGEPIEVAQAIVWLASDEASYITGSFVDLSGGL